jgi:hypothetical protein
MYSASDDDSVTMSYFRVYQFISCPPNVTITSVWDFHPSPPYAASTYIFASSPSFFVGFHKSNPSCFEFKYDNIWRATCIFRTDGSWARRPNR